MPFETKRVILAKAEETAEDYQCGKCGTATQRTGSGGVWTIAHHYKENGKRCSWSGKSITD